MLEKIKEEQSIIFHWLRENFDEYTMECCDEQQLDSNIEFFEFHKSWDWLMPVVEKIENLGFPTVIKVTSEGQTVCILTGTNGEYITTVGKEKILTIYDAVIMFIKWHNNTKK